MPGASMWTRALAAVAALAGSSAAAYGAPQMDDETLRTALVEAAEMGGVAVAPDGLRVAVRVERAEVREDRLRTTWYVVDLNGRRPPQHVADGGDPPWIDNPRPVLNTGRGVQRAQWSRDGRSFAYLKRQGGATQVWLASVDVRGDRRISAGDRDVEEVRWSDDGRSLLLRLSPYRRDSLRRAAQEEKRNGVLFDIKRFVVLQGLSPFFPAQSEATDDPRLLFAVLDPRSGKQRSATADDVEAFYRADNGATSRPTQNHVVFTEGGSTNVPEHLGALFPTLGAHAGAMREFRRSHGSLAWSEPRSVEKSGISAPLALFAVRQSADPVRCDAPACTGRIGGLSWISNDEVAFLRRGEGWGGGRQSLNVWNVASGAVRSVFQTSDVFYACEVAGRAFICLHEAAKTPPELVSVDLDTGATRPVFQPNAALVPELPDDVRRMEWKTAKGEEVFGYFFAAPPAQSGQKAPVVVTPYSAVGFLKAGTGDEWPIASLVRAGLSVFVIQRPENDEPSDRLPAGPELTRALFQDLDYRWRPFRALMSGVDHLVHAGLVDPDRIGISGFSDGAATTIFALLHSHRFAAASTSSLGDDPILYYVAHADLQKRIRVRGADPANPIGNFYFQQTSAAFNALRVTTPILVHSADRELVSKLQSYTSLREAKRPLEMHVFADEYHLKWQPLHRAVIYRRNVDWFRFWLQGYEDPNPGKAAQYARWRELRAERDAAQKNAAPPLPSPDWAQGETGDPAWFEAKMRTLDGEARR